MIDGIIDIYFIHNVLPWEYYYVCLVLWRWGMGMWIFSIVDVMWVCEYVMCSVMNYELSFMWWIMDI